MTTLRTFAARTLLAVVLSAAAGCAANLPPVAVEGSPEDLKALVGDWSGWYESDLAGEPGGSIAFKLKAGDEVAYGDVLMVRRGAHQPFGRHEPDPTGYVLGAPSQSLSIMFVRAFDGRVTGELDPYWDFDRECRTTTIFSGAVKRDVIEGTYVTDYCGPFGRRKGKWRVWKTEASQRHVRTNSPSR